MSERQPRILVVDDEQPLRELVIVTLGDAYFCDEAADGEAALEQLSKRRYDMVLLDVMMPGRSGIEVLREMRAEQATKDVPVIVMSAWQSAQDVDSALEAGANSFLPKPFRAEDLDATVKTLIGRSE